MNSIKIREKFQLFYKEIQRQTMKANAPSYTIVKRWAKHFRQGREDVNDYPRSATPLSQFTGENVPLPRQVINNELMS